MAVALAVKDAVIVEQVHVVYGSTPALDGIDLRVPPGGTLTVLGHNDPTAAASSSTESTPSSTPTRCAAASGSPVSTPASMTS